MFAEAVFYITTLFGEYINDVSMESRFAEVRTLTSNPAHNLQFLNVLTDATECVHCAEFLLHRRISEHFWTCQMCCDDNVQHL